MDVESLERPFLYPPLVSAILVTLRWPSMSVPWRTILRHFLRAVARLGLPDVVTELVFSDRAAPAEIDARDALVAEAARAFLTAVLEECDCRTVIR